MGTRIVVAIAALLCATACGHTNNPTVTDASGPNTTVSTTKSTSDAVTAPTWGKRYTWPDGLAVEVAAPVACKPSSSAHAPAGARVVKFTITMINGTDKPVDASLVGMGTDVQFNGRKAEGVPDSGGPCGEGYGAGTVLPGKTFTFDMAYAVDPQPGELQMAFRPRFGAAEAVFVGQA